MSQVIRIGTRKSPLAMWQAEQVAVKLNANEIGTEIIPIDSDGDLDLQQPIYKLGITGVFTKSLDIALLNNQIDIAVHSLKDIPTQLPEGIELSAVLERDFHEDVVIWNENSSQDWNTAKIATGSLRRRAFLKYSFPNIQFEDIRGNVQTRLKKMNDQNIDGVIFSLAGILRLDLDCTYEIVNELISAAGQGVIACTSRSNELEDITQELNHRTTSRCTHIERAFLRTLEGGCTAPIGAFAYEDESGKIHFEGGVCEVEGKEKLIISESCNTDDYEGFGEKCALELIDNGARNLLPKRK